MKPKNIIPVFFILAVPVLSACVSSSGGGPSRPSDVNVVVPPNAKMIVSPDDKTDSPKIGSR
ncbi:hypothetical protein [Candidatus Methylobacter oryzae]|uniref:Lipoprotein n=1 Tax=Candidatus Methylobacter oryzae TaxID=2497749 RepID=A0ABY3C9L1_9GAMM|nr:hypothetical protein [Candidatus Methylobacter oryzae]TRW93077.1 hypothetical protein EKO24_013260 [Candidatus Methylobacter oryzae]